MEMKILMQKLKLKIYGKYQLNNEISYFIFICVYMAISDLVSLNFLQQSVVNNIEYLSCEDIYHNPCVKSSATDESVITPSTTGELS